MMRLENNGAAGVKIEESSRRFSVTLGRHTVPSESCSNSLKIKIVAPSKSTHFSGGTCTGSIS